MPFKPGNNANPNGRGHTPNKLTTDIREAIGVLLRDVMRMSDTEREAWVKDNPGPVLSLIGKALPSKVDLDANVTDNRNQIADNLERLAKKLGT